MLGMFVSPRDNKRTDKYAGPTAFWTAIIKRTIELCGPDYPQRARERRRISRGHWPASMNIDRMCAEVVPAGSGRGACLPCQPAHRPHRLAPDPPLYEPRGVNVYLAERIKR
jgi:2,4-dienoyl-CoA reductase-like NADH-dependent reductase (Old Yellow Enzyme family)